MAKKESKKVVAKKSAAEKSGGNTRKYSHEFFEELDDDDYSNEPIKVVYQKYSAFCLANNLQPISAIEFQKQMKKQYNLVIKTVKLDGKKVRIYFDEQCDER